MIGHLLPAVMRATRSAVAALPAPQQALTSPFEIVERLHNAAQRELGRWNGQSEASSRAPRGGENPPLRQKVERLRQVVARKREGFGDGLYRDGLLICVLGKIQHRAQRVLGRLREYHSSSTELGLAPRVQDEAPSAANLVFVMGI